MIPVLNTFGGFSTDSESEGFRKGRIIGGVFLAAGIGLAYYILNTMKQGGTLDDRVVILAPIAMLCGLAYIIEPRIWLAGMRNAVPQQPVFFKILGYVIAFLGAGIGMYVRYTYFREVAP
jgi:hypothetical protein